MKSYIIITSVFPPTEAVIRFSEMSNHKLIVVGDNKTPENWHCRNVDFVSVGEQKKLPFELNKVLPYNHYCRKMVGYLMAMQNGATSIIDTDDDNIPKVNWVFPEFDKDFSTIAEDKGFVNIYQYYTKQKIWPRGLPLSLIHAQFDFHKNISNSSCRVGIWQGLADEDPDVDAIYRLTSDAPCYFNDEKPIVLGKGTVSPFNSQNTLIRQELFPLLYLPTYVTFRFTDILRGLVAQPIMWLHGYQLGFTNATVIQKRNPHDYMKDFLSEAPMYEHCDKIIDLVSGSIHKSDGIETSLFNAYKALLKEGIIIEKEMVTLDAWLNDIKKLSRSA